MSDPMRSRRILAQDVMISNDTWATGMANNDLIVGASGGGKTRGYVLPNLMNSQESFLVTDTKGTLRKQVGPLLERRGFQVQELDFSDLIRSPYGYNPLRFIRWLPERQRWREQDILTVAAALVPVQGQKDPFWDFAARNLLEALIGYTLDFLPEKEHDLVSVARLLAEAESGLLDTLMREACVVQPGSFTALRWKGVQSGRRADRMYSSILGILSQNLSAFSFGDVQDLFRNPRQVDFAQISRQPTALFLTVSDSDFSLSKLTSLFYTQAIQSLIAEADSRPDNRLRIPTRLYLDDFANLLIPDIDKTISIIRSREISVSILIQSIAQLRGLYGQDGAMTIIDNCDHLLYLGGQSLETANFIAAKANKPASSILRLPRGQCWLFERGAAPQQVHRYDLKGHPMYDQLPESGVAAPMAGPPSRDQSLAISAEP